MNVFDFDDFYAVMDRLWREGAIAPHEYDAIMEYVEDLARRAME